MNPNDDAEEKRARQEYEKAFRIWLHEIDEKILTGPYLRFWIHIHDVRQIPRSGPGK